MNPGSGSNLFTLSVTGRKENVICFQCGGFRGDLPPPPPPPIKINYISNSAPTLLVLVNAAVDEVTDVK